MNDECGVPSPGYVLLVSGSGRFPRVAFSFVFYLQTNKCSSAIFIKTRVVHRYNRGALP